MAWSDVPRNVLTLVALCSYDDQFALEPAAAMAPAWVAAGGVQIKEELVREIFDTPHSDFLDPGQAKTTSAIRCMEPAGRYGLGPRDLSAIAS